MSRSNKSERRYTSARERADKQSTGYSAPYLKLPDKVTLFKAKAGVMLLDIIPYIVGKGNPWAEPGNLHYERTYYSHRGIGANEDSYLCARMSSKGRCPVCEHRLSLLKSADGDEDKEAAAKDLSPKQRQLFNVINLKEPDKGVQLWDISYHLFGRLLDLRIRDSDEDDGWEKFFFLEDGFTLKVGFTEKSFAGNSFVEAETIDFKPRKEQYDDEILEETHCLDKLLVQEPYDDLKKVLLQTAEDEEDEEEDEEEDTTETLPKKKRKAAEPEDEEEEEDEDDWEEDEEPTPKKKKPVDDDEEDEAPKKKKKPIEDDEDEDEEEEDTDDEDEDESRPKKKNRFASQKDDKGWDADEDDEEDEEEEAAPKKKKPAAVDDEEDEELTPKKKKPAKDEDEEEEDDEDDWDEEPAPKKKKK